MAGLGLAGCGAQRARAAPVEEYWVSPSGDDSTGDGSQSNPWATVGKARDYIRTNNRVSAVSGDIRVNVEAGDYAVTSPITFTDADSGDSDTDVIYYSVDGPGQARLVGGEEITGWSQYSGNIYRADVSSFLSSHGTFHTLYENGTRARKARKPDQTDDDSFAPYFLTDGVDGSHTTLTYDPNDIDPGSWSNADDAEVVLWSGGYWDWFMDVVPIDTIDTGNNQLTLTNETRYPIYRSSSGSRYFVQNALDFLDEAGEFYLDQTNEYLYYWARDGDISNQTVVAPTVERIVELEGSSETSRVEHLVFDGLAFEYSDFTDWYRYAWVNNGDSGEGHTYPEFDRQMELHKNRTGMLYLENTRYVDIVDCHFRNSGYSSIYMLFANENNTVDGNHVEHSGYNGVTMTGKYPGEGDVSKNNTVTNNYIHNVGELVGHSAGVEMTNSGSNEVSDSVIHDSKRYAVTWRAYTGIQASDIYATNNLMQNLTIYRCNTDSGDTAPVYAWGLAGQTSTVDQVTIDDIHADPSMTDYDPNAVFMDNESDNQDFVDVEAWNIEAGQFRTNDSSGHTTTNVSWESGFDRSRMNYDDHGVHADFEYSVPEHVAAPTGLDASRDANDDVALSWNQPRLAETYNVYRSTSSGGSYGQIASDVTTESYTDTTASSGTTYYYVVAAIDDDSGQESGYSNEANSELFSDGFENGLGNWTTYDGTPSTTTAQAHSGSYSFGVGDDREVIHHDFGSGQNDVVRVWFYDDASDSDVAAVARVDPGPVDSGSNFRAMGVATDQYVSNYTYRVDGTWYDSGISRSTGWHELVWDYSSGSELDMYFDGTHLHGGTGVTDFQTIALGDWWADYKTGAVYFDDVEVTQTFFEEDFENGLGEWSTYDGTPSTTTAESYSGSYSFGPDDDREVIHHDFDAALNKHVTVQFYDDASDDDLEVLARVDEGPVDGSGWRAMGVTTAHYQDNYVYRVNGTIYDTGISRSTGWHELAWDYTSGTEVEMSFDGTVVNTDSGVTDFDTIGLGDWWQNGSVGDAYFDDVIVE